jgi:hypothetical protein
MVINKSFTIKALFYVLEIDSIKLFQQKESDYFQLKKSRLFCALEILFYKNSEKSKKS